MNYKYVKAGEKISNDDWILEELLIQLMKSLNMNFTQNYMHLKKWGERWNGICQSLTRWLLPSNPGKKY